jgi:transcriptional regulator with XRE-family HTH domain
MDNDSIKKNLLKIRLEHNMSQEEMADILGVARNTYRNIEKGGTRLLSETVMKVAAWAGITPEEVALGYAPVETGSTKLKDARERFNYKVKVLTEDYEARLDALRQENALLKDLIKEKDDNIRTLKSLVALLENKKEDEKND